MVQRISFNTIFCMFLKSSVIYSLNSDHPLFASILHYKAINHGGQRLSKSGHNIWDRQIGILHNKEQ